MRIILFSDSHGSYPALRRVAEEHAGEAGLFLHLGDGERELDRLKADFPSVETLGVCGNCDWGCRGKTADMLRVHGKKIFFTHGHLFHVKNGLSELEAAVRGLGADVALFGHTHEAFSSFDGSLHLFNPGSISTPRTGRPSYGVMDVSENGIELRIVRL